MRFKDVMDLAEEVARNHLYPNCSWWVDERQASAYHCTATLRVGAKDRAVLSLGGMTAKVARRRLVAAILGRLIVRACRAHKVTIIMDGGPVDLRGRR